MLSLKSYSIGCVATLGFLSLSKYYAPDFNVLTIEIIGASLIWPAHVVTVSIIIPLGIGFYLLILDFINFDYNNYKLTPFILIIQILFHFICKILKIYIYKLYK
jgi:hypothetical protein